jgi:hypothetical protein
MWIHPLFKINNQEKKKISKTSAHRKPPKPKESRKPSIIQQSLSPTSNSRPFEKNQLAHFTPQTPEHLSICVRQILIRVYQIKKISEKFCFVAHWIRKLTEKLELHLGNSRDFFEALQPWQK